MPTMMMIGDGGSINPDRVLMVGSLRSAPIKRLLKYVDPGKVVNMTYGYPQRSVIIFDNGILVITPHEVNELSAALGSGRQVSHGQNISH